jgi:hypothetical protein
MKNTPLLTFFSSIALLTSFTGCGGDDDIFGSGGRTEVDEIQADDGVIALGEGTVVTFNFSFDDDDVLNDDGNVRLVVKLPNGLRYRPNSSEIDEPGSNDKEVGAQILECSSSGESYLLFDMDRFDLRGADAPNSDSDAQLKLTVDGTRRGSTLVIEARADKDRIAYGCDVSFVPDEQEVISVS